MRRIWPLFAVVTTLACAGRGPDEAAPAPQLSDTTVGRMNGAGVDPPRLVPALISPLPAIPPLSHDVRVCAGGDVMLGSNLDSTWAAEASAPVGIRVPYLPDAAGLVLPLWPVVVDADAVLVNVEGAIGAGPYPRKCREGSRYCYAFRQPPAAAHALRRLAPTGVVVGNVANNHAMDAGADGFAATLAHLVESGVVATGYDTLAAVAVTAAGDTIAFLGFSTFQAGPDARDLAAVARHVARARERYARVIVTMHMGAEGAGAQRTPQEVEMFVGENRGNSVAFARTAVAAGATAVIGHGPHVMRGAEWVGDAFVAYSLGNLLTYGPFNMGDPRDRGGFLCVLVDRAGRVRAAELRSTQQERPGLVRRDPTGRAAFLVDSLSRLDFPETGVRLREGGRFERPRR